MMGELLEAASGSGAFDDVPFGMAYVDAGGAITQANLRMRDLLTERREEIVGRSLSDLLGAPLAGPFADAMAGRATFVISRKHHDAERWLRVTLSHRRDEARAPFVCSIDDVTRQAQEEAELRASERYYKSIFENLHDPGLVITPDEIVIDVNAEACRVYGIRREDFIGLDMQSISVDLERGPLQMKRLLRGEDVRFESEQYRGDGSLLQLDISATPIPYRNGIAVLTMNRDVTDERRREAALLESEERYRNLFEGAPIGICRVASNGRLLAVNDALARLLGYSTRDELLSVPSVRSFFVERAERRQFEHDLMRHALSTRQVSLRRADGQTLSAQLQARLAGDVIEAFVVDVTDRIVTAKRLEVAERVAGLGRVTTSVAHEFNNVLMGILPVVEVLERRVTDPKLSRLLAGMKLSVARGKKITQEILHFTRQAEPVVQRIEVLPYLRTVSDELMLAVGRSIDIAVEVSDDALAVNADAAQLREVFTHLAMNARDAMPAGGVLTLAASHAPGAGVVQFRVTDTGTGMTPDVQQRAFEPLFTTRASASGLGLPLVQRIIKAHGGELFLESAAGRGTSVHFSLAAADPYHGLDSHSDRARPQLNRR